MKRFLVRIAGIALIVAGICGLIFSFAGLFAVAQAQVRVEETMLEHLELVERTLVTTSEGLAVAENTLTQAVEAMASLEVTVAGLGDAIDGTAPMVDSVAVLLGEQLPKTIESTQNTLSSLSTSAKLVDDFLAVVTSLPLLNMVPYNPEVPLHEGVGDVADSLDGIPQSLEMAQQGLSSAGGSVGELQGEVESMAGNIGEIRASLESAQAIVVDYQHLVTDVQDLVTWVQVGLPEWLQWLRLGLSLVLIWLGVAQIGLIAQGWELIARSRKNSGQEAPTGPVAE